MLAGSRTIKQRSTNTTLCSNGIHDNAKQYQMIHQTGCSLDKVDKKVSLIKPGKSNVRKKLIVNKVNLDQLLSIYYGYPVIGKSTIRHLKRMKTK